MKQIFINIPVLDVNKSMDFYTQLGFEKNPLFTFEDQKCMVWTDSIYIMLQTHKMFESGLKRKAGDPINHPSATFTLPVDSLGTLNQIVENGIKAGGLETTPPIDEGFMQIRNIQDLDGHNWGIIYLDMAKFKEMKNR